MIYLPLHLQNRFGEKRYQLVLVPLFYGIFSLATFTIFYAPVAYAEDSADQRQRMFAVPAGSLSNALSEFAGQAGVALSFNAALLKELSSPGLNGLYSIDEGFALLLKKSEFKAVNQGRSSYVLQKKGQVRQKATNSGTVLNTVYVQEQSLGQKEKIYSTAGSVGVVTREEIDRLPPRNTADVLKDMPGVMTSNDRQNPGVRVNLRGLEGMGRVNVTIDGARQNYQQTGHTGGSSVYVDPELLSEVDVEMGPSSGVGGAGVIGGIVNFRTMNADDVVKEGETFGGRVNATTGTNAYDFAGSLALGAKGESFDVAAGYSRKEIGEYEVGQNGKKIQNGSGLHGDALSFSSQSQQSGLFKTRWRPTNDQEVSLGYVGFDASYTDNDTSKGEHSYRNENNIRVDTVTSKYTWQPDDPFWDLETRLWYTRTTNDQFRDDRGNVGYGTFDVHYETNTAGGSVDNTSTFDNWLGMDGYFNYGVEYFQDWTAPSAVANDGGDPDWFTGSTPKGSRYVASAFSDLELLKEDWLQLGLGLRYDWYQITGKGTVYAGQVENGQAYQPFELDRKADKVSPRLSISVMPWSSTQVYFNYGEGFRPPMISETLMTGSHPGSFSFPYIPNPGLKEETSQSFELGMSFKNNNLIADQDVFRAKVAAFNNRMENYIVGAMVMLPTDINSQSIRYSQVNVQDPVNIYGVEFQTDYDSGDYFANFNLTYTQADLGNGTYDPFPLGSIVVNPDTGNLGGGDGLLLNSLPPEWRYALSGGSRFLNRKIEVGLRMQYVGKRDDQDGNVTSSLNAGNWDQDYFLWDAWAYWKATKDVTLRLSGQNLTDLRYVEALSSSNYLAPGRTVMATLSINF